MPTSGYTPDRVTYRIHNPIPAEHDVIRVDVQILGGEGDMDADEADALVRPHVQALYADVLATTGEPALMLLRTYTGRRDEDLTPEAS